MKNYISPLTSDLTVSAIYALCEGSPVTPKEPLNVPVGWWDGTDAV